jgi:hypothetical protein
VPATSEAPVKSSAMTPSHGSFAVVAVFDMLGSFSGSDVA